jgi:putative ABC transport system substrate-binding protein
MPFGQLKRRKFITLLGGAAATWPLAARAQQPAMPVVGFMASWARNENLENLVALRQGLSEIGYIEGQNITIEYRWADGQYDRFSALAADLVRRRVNVIVAAGGSGLAAKAATTTIPIVSMIGGDPVTSGYVASLNRPEANLTGVALFAYSLGPKRLELLRELVPNAKVIAVLVNPANADAQPDKQEVEASARAIGQQIFILNASTESALDSAFTAAAQQGAGALVVMADPIFNSRRKQLIALAARYAIPAIYEWREFAVAGGLISYGSSITDAYRQLGIYTGKVLKGERPADLPVMQAVKVELAINLKTAKALGLTVPTALLVRADEVIE